MSDQQAGYSGKPVAEKLGLKPGMRVTVLNSPRDYRGSLGFLPDGISWESSLRKKCDFIHFFTTDQSELKTLFGDLKDHLEKDGMLWISWPKQASGVPTDLTETEVMEIGLSNGLVDVKVVAVDETWSGLKFVYRTKDR